MQARRGASSFDVESFETVGRWLKKNRYVINLYITFMSIGSVIIAAIACPYISPVAARAVSKILGREDHFLTVPPGDGFLKIAVFMFPWIAVSFLLAIPIFLKAPFATTCRIEIVIAWIRSPVLEE